jgi:hypothetical protein
MQGPAQILKVLVYKSYLHQFLVIQLQDTLTLTPRRAPGQHHPSLRRRLRPGFGSHRLHRTSCQHPHRPCRPAWGSCHLAPTFLWMAWILSWSRLTIAWVFCTWLIGRPASPRPVGLALAHLGPPLLCHVDQGSCVAPQVGSGIG